MIEGYKDWTRLNKYMLRFIGISFLQKYKKKLNILHVDKIIVEHVRLSNLQPFNLYSDMVKIIDTV